MLPATRQKIIQEFLLPQGREGVASPTLRIFCRRNRSGDCEPGSGDFPSRSSLLFFLAAKEFVTLDSGNHADGAFFARLGALHAAEAADAYRSGQSNLVGQGQKNLNRRAFPHVLGKKEVDTAGADVPRLGAGFTNRGSRGPTDGKRQPHGKALGSAAFGTSQSSPPD